jgi:hypothetical protein
MPSARWRFAAGVALLAGWASTTHALEGRVLGSLQHVEDVRDDDMLRFLYDLGGRQTLTERSELRLRLSLNYYSVLNQNNYDLWSSRLYAQMRAPEWLVDAQYSPWQQVSPLRNAGRERSGNFGVHWMPRGLPQVEALYSRLDRDLGGFHSFSNDRRIRLSYGREAIGGSVGFRRVDTEPGGGIGVGSRTDEWKGDLRGSRSWRTVNVGGNFETLLSRYRYRERRRELATQQLALNGSYTPARRLTIGGNILQRWGHFSDNATRLPGEVDESAYGLNVQYRATSDLDFKAAREYRRQAANPRAITSDYLQGEVRFRRAMARDFYFQTGYLAILDLASHRGSLPSNSAYAMVDGKLRRGIDGRAEVRASRSEGEGVSGTQWHRSVQLRTRPARQVRFEAEWRKDSLPRFFGLDQNDREWHLLGGYELGPGSTLALSWRRLDGSGRVERGEAEWILSGGHRFGNDSNLSVNWSRRNVLRPYRETVSDVLAVDLGFWLPMTWQARGNYRQDLRYADAHRSYGLVLEKRF